MTVHIEKDRDRDDSHETWCGEFEPRTRDLTIVAIDEDKTHLHLADCEACLVAARDFGERCQERIDEIELARIRALPPRPVTTVTTATLDNIDEATRRMLIAAMAGK